MLYAYYFHLLKIIYIFIHSFSEILPWLCYVFLESLFGEGTLLIGQKQSKRVFSGHAVIVRILRYFMETSFCNLMLIGFTFNSASKELASLIVFKDH